MTAPPIPLVVLGAGGQASETIDVILAVNQAEPAFELLGMADDALAVSGHRMRTRGVPLLGTVEEALGLDAQFTVAIGYPEPRRAVAERVEAAGRELATIVHPRASLGTDVAVGPGTTIFGGVWCSPLVTIGRNVYVSYSVLVGHDTQIGDNSSLFPGAVVSGEVEVGPSVLIGANSVVLQGLRLGRSSVVAAGSTVVRDVEGGSTVMGVPARPVTVPRRTEGGDSDA